MRIEISDIMVTDVGNEAVIFNRITEDMYGLNPIATQMWKSLEKTRDTQATLEAMFARYEVDQAQLESDLQQLVKDLEKYGVICIVEQTT